MINYYFLRKQDDNDEENDVKPLPQTDPEDLGILTEGAEEENIETKDD